MKEVKYGEVNPGDMVYPDGMEGMGYAVIETIHRGSANGHVELVVRNPFNARREEWAQRPYRKLIGRRTPAEQAQDIASAVSAEVMERINIPVTTVHEPTRTRILQGLRARRRNLVNRRAVKESARDWRGVLQLEAQITECQATVSTIANMTEQAPDA